ncbi:hypothetical protein P9112_009236 [Eukaryota sp. TZLM1-RC]
MAWIKSTKTRAYFSRFQVKFRRRRECKTDYGARIRMIRQDARKYGAAKYRFVVRFTNTDVVCQIVRAKLVGDETICSAYSHELKHYGLPVQSKNYAAAYATGLLLARRLLKQLGLDTIHSGVENTDGSEYHIEHEDNERRPFKAILDVGIRRTTTGARLFGALKGAVDGGLHIPHSIKRFPGYDPETKDYDADVHRRYIFGEHVSTYMSELQEEDPDKYKRHFSKYIEANLGADDIAPMFEKVHAAIRADPSPKKSQKDVSKYKKLGQKDKKITLEERKARVAAKLASMQQ